MQGNFFKFLNYNLFIDVNSNCAKLHNFLFYKFSNYLDFESCTFLQLDIANDNELTIPRLIRAPFVVHV